MNMNNQEQNREALIEHIAEQDRIIRRRNQQIANQAQNARESQRAIEEQDARNNSLAADLATAVVRAEKAGRERDEVIAEASKWQEAALRRAQERDEAREANRAWHDRCAAAESRPLTPDAITDEARGRAYRAVAALSVCDWDDMSGVAKGRAMAVVEAVIAEITRPESPARPEGAEKVETVLHQYWSGDINGDDLADRIAEEMNR